MSCSLTFKWITKKNQILTCKTTNYQPKSNQTNEIKKKKL